MTLTAGKMFETTKYNNFRPGRPLRIQYPQPLFEPVYTHHFVQVRGGGEGAGRGQGAGVYAVCVLCRRRGGDPAGSGCVGHGGRTWANRQLPL